MCDDSGTFRVDVEIKNPLGDPLVRDGRHGDRPRWSASSVCGAMHRRAGARPPAAGFITIRFAAQSKAVERR
jgi:hypothetical protein